MMAVKAADFYFDPVSPFAFLAWRLLRRDGFPRRFLPVPIVLAAVLDHWGQRGPAEIPPKRLLTYRHCLWLAGRHGIEMRFPPVHPFRSLEASRLIVALGATPAAVDAVFQAVFVEGRDLGEPAVVEALCRQLGLPGASPLTVPAVKDALRANTDRAIAHGVFGVPTLVVDDVTFWGVDALDMAREYCARPDMFGMPDMKRLESVRQGGQRKVKAT